MGRCSPANRIALFPAPGPANGRWGEITTLAEAVGGEPYFIGVDEHDSFVAAVSHLPFVLSTALVGCTSKSANWSDIGQLASSGYRDITRLASGDAVMHRDICVSNPQPIVAWIDAFIRELYEYRKILDTETEPPDLDAMLTMFEDARIARDKWMAGEVNPRARELDKTPQYPTFNESMGANVSWRLGRARSPAHDGRRTRQSGSQPPFRRPPVIRGRPAWTR